MNAPCHVATWKTDVDEMTEVEHVTGSVGQLCSRIKRN